MPNSSRETDQQILTLLKQANNIGLKISELEKNLKPAMPRRTLQRRLASLQENGAILAQGAKSAVRYFIAESRFGLPLSKTAKRLKAQVGQPLTKRKPVAYQPDFLLSYQPNTTFYLSEKTRSHLFQIGQQFHQKLPPGTFVKKILQRLLIDLSWNSSRLEGNTYSLLETERLITYGAEAEGKNAFEAQMIINHKEAIAFMIEHVASLGLHKYRVLNIHALLSNNLLANPRARGQLRQIPVGINQTVYHPPEIPQVIESCFQTILDYASKIQDPFEQAFFLMVQLPYLQPFEDVNKRVSRLVANIPLMQYNLSPLSFIDVPQEEYIGGLLAVYELNNTTYLRDVFVWAYERSAMHYRLMQDTLTEPNILMMRYRKTLHELINIVVSSNVQGRKIITFIKKWSEQHVEKTDQPAFIRLAEQELASLHEGNIAVYHIPFEVFSKWQKK